MTVQAKNRALYGDAMLVSPCLTGTNMAAVKLQKHLSLCFAIETKDYCSRVLRN